MRERAVALELELHSGLVELVRVDAQDPEQSCRRPDTAEMVDAVKRALGVRRLFEVGCTVDGVARDPAARVELRLCEGEQRIGLCRGAHTIARRELARLACGHHLLLDVLVRQPGRGAEDLDLQLGVPAGRLERCAAEVDRLSRLRRIAAEGEEEERTGAAGAGAIVIRDLAQDLRGALGVTRLGQELPELEPARGDRVTSSGGVNWEASSWSSIAASAAPRSRAERAAPASAEATASSGPSAASARCRARSSGSDTRPASSRWTARLAATDAEP